MEAGNGDADGQKAYPTGEPAGNEGLRYPGGFVDAVEEIKSRLSIEDVVGRYVDLKRSGASFKGLCPFHQEKSPSFYVTPHRGSYHCFGCGKGGDVFSFTMEAERLNFPEALRRLAEQAGVSLPEREPNKPSLKGTLYEINEATARFYHEKLRDAQGGSARAYLAERGFGDDAIELFQLGYAPQGREALVQELRGSGAEDRILLAAGLALQDEIGGTLRDRFRGRLMFPIKDVSGRVSGFGGRTLSDAQPKYLNSPQTEIFDKSSVLFGVHLAAESLRKGDRGALVEGYLDTVRAHIGGFPWTVASLGTAITVPQLTALGRLTRKVTLALDPDPAGQSAAARAGLTALAEVTTARGREAGEAAAVDLRIATLPVGLGDPDELIRDQPERWEQIIEAAVPAFEFYFWQTLQSLDRTTDAWRQEAIDRLLPVIKQFSGAAVWQATWIQRLALETKVDPRALERSLPAAAHSRPRSRPSSAGERTREVTAATTSRALVANPQHGIEQALLALLLQVVVVPAAAAEELKGVTLERPEHQALLEHILAWAPGGNYDYEMLHDSLPEDIREYANELRARQAPLPDAGKIGVAIALHLARTRQFRIQAQLIRTSQAIDDVDSEGRAEAMAALARLTRQQRDVEQLLDSLSKQVLQASTGGSE